MRRVHPLTWLLMSVLAIGLPACRQLGTRSGASPTPMFSPAPNYSPAPAAEGPLPPPPMAGFSKPKAGQPDVKASVVGTEPRRGWWSRLWPGGPGEKSADVTEMSPVSSETEVELNESEDLSLPDVPMESTRVELPQWQQLSATEEVETPVPPPQDAEDFFPLDRVAGPLNGAAQTRNEVVVEIDLSTFLAELDFHEIEPAPPVAAPIVTGPVADRSRVPVQSQWQLTGGPDAFPNQGVDHGIRIEPGPIGAPLPMESSRPKLLPWRASPVWAGQNPGWDRREIR